MSEVVLNNRQPRKSCRPHDSWKSPSRPRVCSFPTVSLLLLAYTNRFVALASIIRGLHDKHLLSPNVIFTSQLKSLRFRIILIRNMQAAGVFSLVLCSISMFLIYIHRIDWGASIFGFSLIALMVSLGLSLWEIMISVDALTLHLKDMERELDSDS